MKTTIDHTVRQKMDISCDAYVLLEALIKSKFKGKWPAECLAKFGFKDDVIFKIRTDLWYQGYLDGINADDADTTLVVSDKAMKYFKQDNSQIISDVIEYLNKKLESSLSPETKATIEVINARVKDGFTYPDFIMVIDDRYRSWKNTTQEEYLRPITLFGNKFEGYLQAAKMKIKPEPENQSMKGMVM